MITDEALRAALEEVDDAILASLPDPSECEHQFSARFEKRMQKVRRRARHPIAYKALRQAACFLLAILILFSSIMVFSAEARAAVVDWIKEQFEIFSHYFFAGNSDSIEDGQFEYQLSWVPDGYRYANTQESDNRTTLIYISDSGGLLQFSYLYGAESNTLFMDQGEYEHKVTSLKNSEADIYIALNDKKTNGIVWSDDQTGALLYISADLSEDELLKIASEVTKKEK